MQCKVTEVVHRGVYLVRPETGRPAIFPVLSEVEYVVGDVVEVNETTRRITGKAV